MINYKHLHYFWVVAKEGGITRASERLYLTPQTISGQLGLLERHLGEELFVRSGRTLELTDAGRLVLSYAEEIFALGGELEAMIHNLPSGRVPVFKVGVAEVVPKSIAYRLLEPVLQLPDSVRIICREGSVQSLLAELALHRIDLVIADSPIPAGVSVRGFNHLLGDCGISFLTTSELAGRFKGDFPRCLEGEPLIIPSDATAIRVHLLQWLQQRQIHPRIVGEFDDSALMKTFGRAGAGVFIAPTPIAREVEQQYDVVIIGQTEEVRDHFYAISAERKVSHPAVSVILETAREWLGQGLNSNNNQQSS